LDSLPILRLLPGEYNELGIRVKNPGQTSLVIQLTLDCNYPSGWCICGYESEIELPPGTYQDLAIAFKSIPIILKRMRNSIAIPFTPANSLPVRLTTAFSFIHDDD
jgi:hypothetical protein